MKTTCHDGLTSGPVFVVQGTIYHKNPETAETYTAYIHMDHSSGKWYVEETTKFYTWPREIMKDGK